MGADVALAVADLLALVADEAAEAPGLDGDALGDDLLHIAFGVEVCEYAGAVGEPLALALEVGDDGGDGVDAGLRSVVAGDGFAFVGLRSAGSSAHSARLAHTFCFGKRLMAALWRAVRFSFFGFGLRDDSRIAQRLCVRVGGGAADKWSIAARSSLMSGCAGSPAFDIG
jgi:hypothetical protein